MTERIGGAALQRIIVSDLHLTSDASSDARARAFASFLGHLAALSPPPRLVLLGDILHLPNHVMGHRSRTSAMAEWEAHGMATLAAVIGHHADVFDALSGLSRRTTVEVVPGNHDLLLARPAAQDLLMRAAGPVSVDPWILYVPGVLYAEHGHQHHDLNTVRNMLELDPRGDAAGAPAAWALERMMEGGTIHRAGAAVSLVGGTVATQAALPRLVRSAAAYRARRLVPSIEGLALPGDVLVAIDEFVTRTPSETVMAATQRVAGMLRGRTSPSYLVAAARGIDRLLAERGLAVPLYVFGHTHAATVEPLDAASPDGPRYANPGSWGQPRPRSEATRVGLDRYPFLSVTDDDAHPPVATLRVWHAARRVEEAYGSPTPPIP